MPPLVAIILALALATLTGTCAKVSFRLVAEAEKRNRKRTSVSRS